MYRKFYSKLIRCLGTYYSIERNLVFATNPNFPIPIYLERNYVNLRYFKLSLFYITEVKV